MSLPLCAPFYPEHKLKLVQVERKILLLLYKVISDNQLNANLILSHKNCVIIDFSFYVLAEHVVVTYLCLSCVVALDCVKQAFPVSQKMIDQAIPLEEVVSAPDTSDNADDEAALMKEKGILKNKK